MSNVMSSYVSEVCICKVCYEGRVCVRHRLPLLERDLEGTIVVELGGGRGDVQGV